MSNMHHYVKNRPGAVGDYLPRFSRRIVTTAFQFDRVICDLKIAAIVFLTPPFTLFGGL
jgi:hypothetical protein